MKRGSLWWIGWDSADDIGSSVSTSNIIWEGKKVWSLWAIIGDRYQERWQLPPQTWNMQKLLGVVPASHFTYDVNLRLVREVYVGLAFIQGLLPMWEVYGMSNTFTHPREGHSNSRRMENGRGRLATYHSGTFRNKHHNRKWTMNWDAYFSASHVSLPGYLYILRASCFSGATKQAQCPNFLGPVKFQKKTTNSKLITFSIFSITSPTCIPTSKSTRNSSPPKTFLRLYLWLLCRCRILVTNFSVIPKGVKKRLRKFGVILRIVTERGSV